MQFDFFKTNIGALELAQGSNSSGQGIKCGKIMILVWLWCLRQRAKQWDFSCHLGVDDYLEKDPGTKITKKNMEGSVLVHRLDGQYHSTFKYVTNTQCQYWLLPVEAYNEQG
jgi:hypothetical protein